MSVVTEAYIAERWLFSTLTGHGPLVAVISDRVYSYVAPQGATRPFVVFQQQAGTDLNALGAVRIWSNMLYVVRVVGDAAGWGPLAVAADELDKAIHGKGGTAGGATILDCLRESPFALTEVLNGVQYRHLGGRYRIRVQE